MFQNVLNYKPKERDYLVWTIVHPAIWLMPILVVVLLTALAVHSVVLGEGSMYNFLAEADEAAAVAAPAEPAAPAAVEAVAPAAE